VITVLAGGVGAAKFLRGLIDVVDAATITIIGNTGDDEEFYGLHVSPDLDTVVYTLADAVNPETGWGLADDTYNTLEQLQRFGEESWFLLGDRDLATHLHRTALLHSGRTLSEATASIAIAFGVASRLLPMSDDRVRTIVSTGAGDLSFQEYFVQRRQQDEVLALRFDGAESARPAPGVLAAIADAEYVIIAPSNPLVSIGPALAVPGIREALKTTQAPVGAISPIVGGKALKGPADRMLASLGHEVSAAGVAQLYADFLDVLVLDNVDSALAADVEERGVRASVAATVMHDNKARRALAETTLQVLAATPAKRPT
jgi:LPPG:FO 2-phospho-L-lactate transferase